MKQGDLPHWPGVLEALPAFLIYPLNQKNSTMDFDLWHKPYITN
jgi:hypothetical protein